MNTSSQCLHVRRYHKPFFFFCWNTKRTTYQQQQRTCFFFFENGIAKHAKRCSSRVPLHVRKTWLGKNRANLLSICRRDSSLAWKRRDPSFEVSVFDFYDATHPSCIKGETFRSKKNTERDGRRWYVDEAKSNPLHPRLGSSVGE